MTAESPDPNAQSTPRLGSFNRHNAAPKEFSGAVLAIMAVGFVGLLGALVFLLAR